MKPGDGGLRRLADGDRLGALCMLVFSLAYLRASFAIPLDPALGEAFSARTLPVVLAGAGILLSLLRLVLPAAGEPVAARLSGLNWKPAAWLVLVMAVYAAVFDLLGFLIASFLFLLSGFFVLGVRAKLASLAIAGGLVFALWAVLTQVFGLYLDPGAILRPLLGPQP